LKNRLAVFPALVLGLASLANAQGQPPTKVAIIHIQQAILGTKDGQKAQQDMATKFGPKRSELEKKQGEITSLQDQLKKGGATLSADAQAKITKDIDTLNKDLTRGGEDFDAEVQQEEGKLMNDLGQKMLEVIGKYAAQNGFAMVIDVSNQQTVLWADPSSNITAECIKLYDQAHPGTGASPAASKPAAPAATTPRPGPATTPAPKPGTPPATPPTKKQ